MLRPFFSFYGGKWRIAHHYPAPVHDTVIEPFAGSAGYALRYADRKVVLVELDPVVAGVWRYLVRVKASEIRAIPDLPLDGTVDDLRVCAEARWLVGFWLNRGGARSKKSPSHWMRSGIRPGSFWGERVRETVASQLDSIRHWRVLEGDYRCAPDVNATWFVDPPYAHQGKHYRCSVVDYPALSSWCRSRTGQVIVCENAGASWLPFAPLADTKTTRAGRRSREAVWQP
jgi:hypothetical protein